ncbi:MAG: Spy/CpxP family protein refolding chaperone [Gemmatimonadetes bacterium]|nr:Spy/CpxP family protein refolding chaperone [Gemmatimonadota bacterium]
MINAPFKCQRTNVAAFALVAAVAVGASELTAQRQGPGMRSGNAGASAVERAIRLADELQLTQAQRDQLESIRVDMLEQRASRTVSFMTLTSEVRAGIREPEAVRQELAALREELATGATAFRDRFTEILSEDQRAQLRQMDRRGAVRQRGIRRDPRFERQRGIRRQPGVDRRPGNRFRGRDRPGRGRG